MTVSSEYLLTCDHALKALEESVAKRSLRKILQRRMSCGMHSSYPFAMPLIHSTSFGKSHQSPLQTASQPLLVYEFSPTSRVLSISSCVDSFQEWWRRKKLNFYQPNTSPSRTSGATSAGSTRRASHIRSKFPQTQTDATRSLPSTSSTTCSATCVITRMSTMPPMLNFVRRAFDPSLPSSEFSNQWKHSSDVFSVLLILGGWHQLVLADS